MIHIRNDVDVNFYRLVSTQGWLRTGDQAIGMFYDLDGAIAGTLRLNDDQYSVRFDEDGALVGSIHYPRRLLSLEALNAQFYRIWSRITLPMSLIWREENKQTIVFTFVTGTMTFGYSGRVVFWGDAITSLTNKLRPGEAS
jgi:hypothetical protein